MEREEKQYYMSWYVWGAIAYSGMIIMPLWYAMLKCYCWKEKVYSYWPPFRVALIYVTLFRYGVYIWAVALRMFDGGKICAGVMVHECIVKTGDDVNCNPDNVFQIKGGKIMLAYVIIHILKIV